MRAIAVDFPKRWVLSIEPKFRIFRNGKKWYGNFLEVSRISENC